MVGKVNINADIVINNFQMSGGGLMNYERAKYGNMMGSIS